MKVDWSQPTSVTCTYTDGVLYIDKIYNVNIYRKEISVWRKLVNWFKVK